MTYKKWWRAALLGATAMGLGVLADAQTPEVCLTFDNALSLAASNDPSVRVARANLENAEAGLQEARSLRRPQISTFTRFGVGDTGLVDSQIENQIGVLASQRVIDFGDARLARRAAREDVAAQQSLILNVEGQSALRAGLAFIDWLEAAAQLRVTEERVDYFRRQLTAIEALLAQGGSTRVERAEVAAELATAEAFRFEFEFRRDQAAARVAIATGDPAAPCGQAEPQLETGYDALDAGIVENMVADALAVNPEIEALRRSRLSLEAAAKREARARLPAIDVVGIASYGSQDFEGNFDLETRVGVNVTVPIYSGNALTARRRRASAQAARAGGELDAARRELREAIEVTYRRALLLEAQASRRTTVRDLKTDEFEAALIEHSQGLRTLPLLVDVRLELEDAALAGIRAEYDLNRTELELLALTGQLLDGQRGVEG